MTPANDQGSPPPLAIVVGIDGSRMAVEAALWAVDEAVSRDIVLRLCCAVDLSDDADAAPRRLGAARRALHQARTAVESAGAPVKVELEILPGQPTQALLEASRSAAMLCTGSIGLSHFADGRVGSTATHLAASADCPVAIIQRPAASVAEPGWIVAEVDESPDSTFLQRAVDEALLRRAPLRVLTSRQRRDTDVHDPPTITQGNRRGRSQLDRRLAYWRRLHPDLDLRSEGTRGSVLDYLAKDAQPIQLVIVGRKRWRDVSELIGPTGCAALHQASCSVLVCNLQRPL